MIARPPPSARLPASGCDLRGYTIYVLGLGIWTFDEADIAAPDSDTCFLLDAPERVPLENAVRSAGGTVMPHFMTKPGSSEFHCHSAMLSTSHIDVPRRHRDFDIHSDRSGGTAQVLSRFLNVCTDSNADSNAPMLCQNIPAQARSVVVRVP